MNPTSLAVGQWLERGGTQKLVLIFKTSSCLLLHHFVLIIGCPAPVRQVSYRCHLSLLAPSVLVGTSRLLDSVLSALGEWFLKGDLKLLVVQGLYFNALMIYNAIISIFLLYCIFHYHCVLLSYGRGDSEAGCSKEPFQARQQWKSKPGCCLVGAWHHFLSFL